MPTPWLQEWEFSGISLRPLTLKGVGGVSSQGFSLEHKSMDNLTPKEYVLRTLSTCTNGSRITEVLLHYWKHEGLIRESKSDIIQIAEEMFNEKDTTD